MLGNNLLRGEKVYLTAVRREDIPLYAKWFADLEFLSYLGLGNLFPQTEEGETEWYERMRTSDNITFAIRTLADDRLIGNESLMDFDWRSSHAKFGIAVGDKEYWGKGYGTDASRIILRYAFLELNLNRVELDVYSYNKRAIRCYEKVGYRLEATLRQALYRDGEYHDIHVMSILRDEWLALQKGTD